MDQVCRKVVLVEEKSKYLMNCTRQSVHRGVVFSMGLVGCKPALLQHFSQVGNVSLWSKARDASISLTKGSNRNT